MRSWLAVWLALVGVCVCYPELDISGFSWAENLSFDGKGNLFVSDTTTGIVWRITLTQDNSSYEKVPHINEGIFKKVNGLTMSSNPNTLYASAMLQSTGTSWLVAIDTVTPNVFEPLVELPVLGNGLAFNQKGGNIYTTNEGNFIPGQGVIYSIDLLANQTSVAKNHLFAADGAFIDQDRGLLYISEVVTAEVICYTINSDNSIVEKYRFSAPNMIMLDDFTLSKDGSQIYGADYNNGTVNVFNSDGSSTKGTFLMQGLQNPTSVRFSSGAGFNSTCVYVTEGGGLTSFTTNRQVLQSPYALNV